MYIVILMPLKIKMQALTLLASVVAYITHMRLSEYTVGVPQVAFI